MLVKYFSLAKLSKKRESARTLLNKKCNLLTVLLNEQANKFYYNVAGENLSNYQIKKNYSCTKSALYALLYFYQLSYQANWELVILSVKLNLLPNKRKV